MALAATAALLLGACGTSTQPADTTVADNPGTTEAPGMGGGMQVANPASTYCVEQGGTVEMRTEATGQVGYCILPDGTEIEEWEFFNSQSPTTTCG
ncbi:MAG: DUF333 domain-containing protein [Ilumatobacteraceae bacterium]